MKIAKWFAVGSMLSMLAATPALAGDASADRDALLKRAPTSAQVVESAPTKAPGACACSMKHG